MNLKSLLAFSLSTLALTACSNLPVKKPSPRVETTPKVVAPPPPIVYTEPEVSPPFYSLNPFNYQHPPEFEINLYKASTEPVNKLRVKADPNTIGSQEMILDKNRFVIPLTDHHDKALKFAVLAQDHELDVTEIDDFLNILEGKARHYPTQFSIRRERDGMTDKLKSIIAILDQHAFKPNASYDVLLRAAKASHMARNMDMGQQYAPKALNYANRLLKIKPHDPEVSFWLGFGLAEGGALKESIPYLTIAMEGGIQEAYLSMANTYLYLEQKKNAITTLRNYKIRYPSESEVVDRLIADIETGKRYNVWQIIK